MFKNISKKIKKIEKSDLGRSLFYYDIFYWDTFHKNKNDHLGHFFQTKRVKLMRDRHQCLLLQWFQFLSKWSISHYRLMVLFPSFVLHNMHFAVCLLLLLLLWKKLSFFPCLFLSAFLLFLSLFFFHFSFSLIIYSPSHMYI